MFGYECMFQYWGGGGGLKIVRRNYSLVLKVINWEIQILFPSEGTIWDLTNITPIIL